LQLNDANDGRNFLHPAVWPLVQARHALDKGIGLERTTTNLLASQAMAFNVFGPLVPGVAGGMPADAVLRQCWPGIASVERIRFEYTPARLKPDAEEPPEADPFGDQSARGGVDADLRIDFRHQDGARGVLLVETKFVETGFSGCAYRGRSRTRCPDGTVVAADGGNCCYSTRARGPFRYWKHSLDGRVLDMATVRSGPCPFGGGLWQPWLNATLASTIATAETRTAPSDPVRHAWYGVIAPCGNLALHEETQPDAITALRRFMTRPDDVRLVALEDVITAIGSVATSTPDQQVWVAGLQARYVIA